MMITISKDTQLNEALKLASPCNCESCNNGCRYGSGLLALDDLKNISNFLKITEEETKEKYLEEVEQFNKKLFRPKLLRKNKMPFGNCIFFDEQNHCAIHPVKPLQCKTSINCKDYGEDLSKWFMLNYIVDENDPESIRQYSIYLKTNAPIKGGEMESLVKDRKKLEKIMNFDILR